MTNPDDQKICVGKLTSPHGVKGAIKLHSYTADPLAIVEYCPLFGKDGDIFDINVLSSNGDMLIVTVNGIKDRDEVGQLRNTELFVSREILPQIENEDEFYQADLVGLKAVLENGEEFGIIIAFHNFGAGDIVEIRHKGKKDTEMFAFTKANFPVIDMEGGKVTIYPPEVEYVRDNDD